MLYLDIIASIVSIGGVIGQSSLGSDASSNIGGYDPIKSLLNQLQQSDQVIISLDFHWEYWFYKEKAMIRN